MTRNILHATAILALLTVAACSPPALVTYTSYPTPDKNLALAELTVENLKTLALGQPREEVLGRMGADPVEGCVKWNWKTEDKILREYTGFLPCAQREIIRSPYRTDTLRQGGVSYEVLYYYTGGIGPDGGITGEHLTPVLIGNGKLVGWGWSHPLVQDLRLTPTAILSPLAPTH